MPENPITRLVELPALVPGSVGANALGVQIGVADNGLPVALFVGVATNDAGIVAEVGPDARYADGSLYISAVAGAGTLWQKRNGTWTSI